MVAKSKFITSLRNVALVVIMSLLIAHIMLQPLADKEVADIANECRHSNGELKFERDLLHRIVYAECHLQEK